VSTLTNDGVKKESLKLNQAKWYLVRVLPGSEDIVVGQVTSTAKVRGFSNFFKDFFYPKISITTKKIDSNGKEKQKDVTKKLFPGYLAIKMIMNENTSNLVLGVAKVIDFIGSNKTPKALSENDIQSFFESSQKLAKINDSNSVKLGSSVKIKSGSFSGFRADVTAILTEIGSAKVSVLVFNTPTEITVPLSDLELVKKSDGYDSN
jgi:transcriptional antiterminator NusG